MGPPRASPEFMRVKTPPITAAAVRSLEKCGNLSKSASNAVTITTPVRIRLRAPPSSDLVSSTPKGMPMAPPTSIVARVPDFMCRHEWAETVAKRDRRQDDVHFHYQPWL